jgi:hypothetical protein
MMEIDREKRLAELLAKAELSDAEFAERVALGPPGTVISLPNLSMAGPINLDQALQNIFAAGAHARAAFAAGFFIEVLALRSQSLELFLRLFLAAKASPPVAVEPTDSRTLGNLIDACTPLGFDSATLTALKVFNKDRIVGIHKFFLGATSYENLRGLCEGSAGLTEMVVNVLANQLGTPFVACATGALHVEMADPAQEPEAAS